MSRSGGTRTLARSRMKRRTSPGWRCGCGPTSRTSMGWLMRPTWLPHLSRGLLGVNRTRATNVRSVGARSTSEESAADSLEGEKYGRATCTAARAAVSLLGVGPRPRASEARARIRRDREMGTPAPNRTETRRLEGDSRVPPGRAHGVVGGSRALARRFADGDPHSRTTTSLSRDRRRRRDPGRGPGPRGTPSGADPDSEEVGPAVARR
jgi:hypothetical protein